MMWEIAQENLNKQKELNKKIHDEKVNAKNLDLKIGDMVYIINRKKDHKYASSPYEGPYPIIQITSENSIIIKRKNKNQKVHKDHVKKLII